MAQDNRNLYAELLGRRRLSDHIVALLADIGVQAIFGMPAESLNPLIDAIRRDGRIQLVGTRHEGAAGIMASTYGKVTGVPGVCIGTAGPGASHLPFGTYDALADGAPLLALTGQVPVGHVGMQSFQEIDPVSLFSDSTLFNHFIAAPQQAGLVGRALTEALVRQGPVHIACSSDVFAAPPAGTVQFTAPPSAGATGDKVVVESSEILAESDVAVLVGAVSKQVADDVAGLAERLAAPVFVLPEGYGFFGGAQEWPAVRVLTAVRDDVRRFISRAGRILLVGRCSASVDRLVADRPVIQVASGSAWTDSCRPHWIRLLGDEQQIVRRLRSLVPGGKQAGALLPEAEQFTRSPCDTAMWRALDSALPDNAVLSVEPGRILDGAFQNLTIRDRCITSSFGFELPGCAVPGAIGAKFAFPGRRVIAVCTKSGLLDFSSELLTVGRYGIAVDVVCFEDDPAVDLVRAVNAMGLAARRLAASSDLGPALDRESAVAGGSVFVLPSHAAEPARPSSAVPGRRTRSGRPYGLGSIGRVLADGLASLGVRSVHCRAAAGAEALLATLKAVGIEPEFVRNAESAALAASAVAKFTGQPALCLVSSAAELVAQLNGCYDASYDHAPVIVLGLRDSPWILDGTRLLSDVGYTSRLQADGDGLTDALLCMYRAADARRTGYLDIEAACLEDLVPSGWQLPRREPRPEPTPPEADVTVAAGRLRSACRPAILVGRGGRAAGRQIAELAYLLSAPVATTMPGRGAIQDDHPHFVGGIGSSGHLSAMRMLQECDVLLTLGISQRGAAFDLPGNPFMIQVDQDLVRLSQSHRANLKLHGSAADVVEDLISGVGTGASNSDAAKKSFLTERRRDHLASRRHTSRMPSRHTAALRPSTVALTIKDVMSDGASSPLITVDVGLVTLWMYRYVTGAQEFVWSSSFATMGSALPAAIALAPVAPGRQIIAAVGDGGIAVTLSELASVAHLDHPLTIVVFNNGKLGAIKFEQEIMGWPEYGSALHNGDLAELARAFGLQASRAETPEQLRQSLHEARDSRKPYLIDAVCDSSEIPAPAQRKPTATQVVGYAVALSRETARWLQGHGPESGPLTPLTARQRMPRNVVRRVLGSRSVSRPGPRSY